jgi:hypothetical protein
VQADGSILATDGQKQDIYTITIPLDVVDDTSVSAIRLETKPHASLPKKGSGFADGNFVITRIQGVISPPSDVRQIGRFVRIELPGNPKILSLAEVQVFSGAENVARKGTAKQSSTDYAGPAKYAIDGNTDGNYQAKSTTHTKNENSPWWEVDLATDQPIDRIVVWNRSDNSVGTRLNGFRVSILDANRQVVWSKEKNAAPKNDSKFAISNRKAVSFAVAHADFSQPSFAAAGVLESAKPNDSGWAVGSQTTNPHTLTLIPAIPIVAPKGSTLNISIEQLSKFENHTLGHFALQVSSDPRAGVFAGTPANMIALAKKTPKTAAEEQQLTSHFMLHVAAQLNEPRKRLAAVKKQLAAQKPATSVPIMRDMAKKRVTNIQHRGNYLDKGAVVAEGLPAVFNPKEIKAPNRLTLAKWLVDSENPLTSRVIANRYWEAIFGVGIVISSEEFGSQGERPSHPELLDWLATELVRLNWDTKAFMKILVTSAAYRQSSKVNDELFERDPDNRLLARGPRFRLSAEMIRDQALFVSGLLSSKQYGAPVRPPQPILGVKAAFGGGIDWKTSAGEDKFRRGLYTTWRRSNPYPSMVAFDAPNREVCTIRRDRTNTPLQALVTLNDPVYVEAAQALARRMAAKSKTVEEQLAHGFRLCLARPPYDQELEILTTLFKDAKSRFLKAPDRAKEIATMPLGPIPEGGNVTDLAALTIVGNVLLNVDEMFMKR